jgi:hypothetical protein
MKKIALILSILLGSFALIWLLWRNSMQLNKYSNHFNRRFHSIRLSHIRNFPVSNIVKQVVSCSKAGVLFSLSSPGSYIQTNWNLQDSCSVHVPLPDTLSRKIHGDFFTQDNYPWLYLFLFNQNKVLVYNRLSKAQIIIAKPGPLFSRALPISATSIIVRQGSARFQTEELAEWRIPDSTVYLSNHWTAIRYDGGLSSDGSLWYSELLHRVVYICSYTNEFLVMDTTLHQVQRFHTIDTVSHSHVRTTIVEGLLTNDSPAPVNNLAASVDGQGLFVASALKADNESDANFHGFQVIDQYQLPKGDYLQSFYLPEVKGKRIQEIFFSGNHFLESFGDQVIIGQLAN